MNVNRSLAMLVSILIAASLARPFPADKTGEPSPNARKYISEVEVVREFVFYHEAIRLITEDNKQLREKAPKVTGHLWPYAALDDRINIQAEPMASTTLTGYRLYRASNGLIAPAWVYLVAVGARKEVFRLGGFEVNDFQEMLASSGKSVAELGVLGVIGEYYRLVEEFEPGALTTRREVEEAVAAIEASPDIGAEVRRRLKEQIGPPKSQRAGSERMITVIVFDRRSLRTERHTVRVSTTNLKIESREILLDRYRTVL